MKSRWLRRFGPIVGVVIFSLLLGKRLSDALLVPKSGVGVSRDDAPLSGLPKDARHVNYYTRPPFSCYDFDTTEAGYREFVAGWGLNWKQVSEGRGRTPRWNHRTGQQEEVEIEDGLFHGWWEADAIRSLAYDRRTGRAYCSGTYR